MEGGELLSEGGAARGSAMWVGAMGVKKSSWRISHLIPRMYSAAFGLRRSSLRRCPATPEWCTVRHGSFFIASTIYPD